MSVRITKSELIRVGRAAWVVLAVVRAVPAAGEPERVEPVEVLVLAGGSPAAITRSVSPTDRHRLVDGDTAHRVHDLRDALVVDHQVVVDDRVQRRDLPVDRDRARRHPPRSRDRRRAGAGSRLGCRVGAHLPPQPERPKPGQPRSTRRQ